MNAKALCNIWHGGHVVSAGAVFECSEAVAGQLAGLGLAEIIEPAVPVGMAPAEPVHPAKPEQEAAPTRSQRPKKRAKR